MLLFLSIIGGITLLDLVLSGDNALVLGVIASKLPRRQRLLAIAFGGGLAVVARVLFTITATFLLSLPFLEFVGALVVYWIAYKLLIEHENEEEREKTIRSNSLLMIVLTITAADLSMSLDNILAIGALAAGNVWAIVFGLTLSVLILMVASALIAELMKFVPWLLDLAALVLAATAANMIVQDKWVGPRISGLIPFSFTLPGFGTFSAMTALLMVALTAAMLAIDIVLRIRERRRADL